MLFISITKSAQWVDEHALDLQKRYAGKYIAVQDEKVIAVGNTIPEVNAKAKLVVQGKPFLIEFVERGDLHAFSIANFI